MKVLARFVFGEGSLPGLQNFFMCLHMTFSLCVYVEKKKSLMSLPFLIRIPVLGFPGGAVAKNPPANAGDTGLRPGPGRSHMLQSN